MAESIEIVNQQDRCALELGRLEDFAPQALHRVQETPGPEGARDALAEVETVEVAIVSDEVIAGVHEKFMKVPGATDVITFDHGEIVISADTAARQAGEYGLTALDEVALYLVHGLLHLRGFDDREEATRRVMHAVQDVLYHELWRIETPGE